LRQENSGRRQFRRWKYPVAVRCGISADGKTEKGEEQMHWPAPALPGFHEIKSLLSDRAPIFGKVPASRD